MRINLTSEKPLVDVWSLKIRVTVVMEVFLYTINVEKNMEKEYLLMVERLRIGNRPKSQNNLYKIY